MKFKELYCVYIESVQLELKRTTIDSIEYRYKNRLDERFGNLDIESITSLNEGLSRFLGVVIIATFDQELIETVSNRLIEIKKDGTIRDKQMSYAEYIEKFGENE